MDNKWLNDVCIFLLFFHVNMYQAVRIGTAVWYDWLHWCAIQNITRTADFRSATRFYISIYAFTDNDIIGCDKSIANIPTEHSNQFYSFINAIFFLFSIFQIYNFQSTWVMSLKIIHSWRTIHCNRCTGVWSPWIDARKCDWTAVHTSMEQIM